MFNWLVRNVTALLLSLALAIVIWVVALNEQDPFEEKVFPQPVPIAITNLPGGMVLVGNPPTTVDVRVRAPASVWASLNGDQLHAFVDLSGAQGGSVTLPIQATVDQRDARITGITPAEIHLTVETIATRTVPVRLVTSGDAAVGYQVGKATVQPATASISGPASLADTVSELVAQVSLAGAKQDFDGHATLTPLNADGQTVAGVTVEPAEVAVTIPVRQLGGYRDVAVKANYEGQVAAGYRITNIFISPPVVTLFSSDPALVTSLPGFVETERLDISEATDDIQARLGLELPAGVSLVGDQTVVVQVSIAAIESSLTIQRDLEIQGLGPGLTASASPATVDVILSGPLSTLDTLTPDAVRVVLDLLNLPPGLHQVTPQVVVLPEGISVQTVLPGTIEVLITGPGTATRTFTATPTGTAKPATQKPAATATRAPALTPTPTPTPTPTLTQVPPS